VGNVSTLLATALEDQPAFNSSGAVIGVITPVGLLEWQSSGPSTGKTDALNEKSVFYIASVSKQFTAACVFLAAADGAISTDDQLSRFVPNLPAWANDVRISNLLGHSAGLPDYGKLIEATGRSFLDPFDDDLILDVLVTSAGPSFEPGSAVEYSNTGYVLLGIVLKVATGESLRRFATRRLFGPLGMTDTWYRDDYREEIVRLVDGHVMEGGQVKPFESCFDRVGDGGVVSTLADWSIWESTLLAKREPWFTLSQKLADPFALTDGSISSWRSGVVIEVVGSEVATLAGGTGFGYRAFSARFPVAGFSVCCLSNLETADVRGASLRVAEQLLNEERFGLKVEG
jgi:CubicO group peptidase (beta-lactamase class C family)